MGSSKTDRIRETIFREASDSACPVEGPLVFGATSKLGQFSTDPTAAKFAVPTQPSTRLSLPQLFGNHYLLHHPVRDGVRYQ